MKRSTKAALVFLVVVVGIVIAGNLVDSDETESADNDNTVERTSSTIQTSPPSSSVSSQPTQITKPTCDPSYQGVCIPPYPPDLDCGDIPYKKFRVTGEDRHGFDRDNDGIGCES